MGTPGAEGGPGKRAGRNTGTAPWPDPTCHGSVPRAPGMRRVRSADRKRGPVPVAGEGAQEANAGRPVRQREVGGIVTGVSFPGVVV
jgi:hypothetical protein